MLVVRSTEGRQENFYSLSEAAAGVIKNQWGTPVDGIHSETLRRRWRDTHARHGKRIGRDVFFTADDMSRMGYEMNEDLGEDYLVIGDVVTLVVE